VPLIGWREFKGAEEGFIMAMLAKEIKEWIATIDDDKAIAVDEGGLNLVVKGERSFCEVGGIPLAEHEEEGTEWLEPGWEMHL
jgi:hypothetical protein